MFTHGEVFATKQDAAANDKKQPALNADRNIFSGRILPFFTPALETISMAWAGEYELKLMLNKYNCLEVLERE